MEQSAPRCQFISQHGKIPSSSIGEFPNGEWIGHWREHYKKDNKLLLLDNAYVLKIIDNGTTVRNVSQFSTFAKNFAKSTKASVQRELMEGQLTEEFMKESELITTLAALLCRINSDVHRLQLLNLHSFPDTVGEMLYAEKGMTITPRGDAYMVRQCKK